MGPDFRSRQSCRLGSSLMPGALLGLPRWPSGVRFRPTRPPSHPRAHPNPALVARAQGGLTLGPERPGELAAVSVLPIPKMQQSDKAVWEMSVET
jgi:hypothetical protein